MLIHIDTKGYTEKPKEHISIIKPRLQSKANIKDLSQREIINFIERGYTISPAVMDGNGCKADNWLQQQLFMIDIDNDKDGLPLLSVANALEIQISNFDVSFSDGVFSNVKYSFLVATDIYPLEKIVQINYVGDIFTEPSRAIGNEVYANQLISCGDLKNVLSIIDGSEIVQGISSNSPAYMELSFIGITDIGTASHDVEKIYVIMQNEIVPLSEVENMQQTSYFVFNIITDTDNIWICY